MEHYPSKLELRIDWSELDLFGHVNNVAVLKYIQASRINYWELIGLAKLHKETNTGPMLATTTCNFFQPLFYPGNIIVQAGLDFIKNTSFGIQHQILNDKNEPAAEAKDVIVLYDFNTNLKVQIPDDLRAAIERTEKQ